MRCSSSHRRDVSSFLLGLIIFWTCAHHENCFVLGLVTIPLPPMSISLFSDSRDQYTLDLLHSALLQSVAYLDDYFATYYNSTSDRTRNSFSKVDMFLNSGGIRAAPDGEDSYAYFAMINLGGYACYLEKGETETHVRKLVQMALAQENQKEYMAYLAQSGDSFLEGLVAMDVEWLEYNRNSRLLSAVAVGLGVTGALLAMAAVLYINRRELIQKLHAMATTTTTGNTAETLEREEELISSKGETHVWA